MPWRNAAVPLALEILILRLLEKEADKRPLAAAEVRQALSTVAQAIGNGRSAVANSSGVSANSQLPPASDNPMYPRVFVGREAAVRQLQAAFDAATSG